MKARRIRSMVLIGVGVLSAGIFGCPGWTPWPASVLEGTWELIPSDTLNPQLAHWYLTFDSRGDLTQVKYTFVDLTTVTWNNPQGRVDVDGTQVHISSTKSGNGLTFDGTLDSETEPATAAGNLTANLIFADIHISTSQGEATLVKQ